MEIPRVRERGSAISASHVRELLKDRCFDDIAKLVPETTLEYLKRGRPPHRHGRQCDAPCPAVDAPNATAYNEITCFYMKTHIRRMCQYGIFR